jgi:hypothetical protein
MAYILPKNEASIEASAVHPATLTASGQAKARSMAVAASRLASLKRWAWAHPLTGSLAVLR